MIRHNVPDPTGDLDALDDALASAAALNRREPRWRSALLGALFALAIVVIAGVASYAGADYAYARAEQHTDRRIAVLEGDLSQRRAGFNAQFQQLRRIACILADHVQPRDDAVEQVRAEFGCTGGPYPVPSPTR